MVVELEEARNSDDLGVLKHGGFGGVLDGYEQEQAVMTAPFTGRAEPSTALSPRLATTRPGRWSCRTQ